MSRREGYRFPFHVLDNCFVKLFVIKPERFIVLSFDVNYILRLKEERECHLPKNSWFPLVPKLY